MARRKTAREDDLTDLSFLHMIEVGGMTIEAAGRMLGMNRGQSSGTYFRINKATDEADVSPHLNGTMPERWWDNEPV